MSISDCKREKLTPFVDLRSAAGFKDALAGRADKDIRVGVLNEILPPEAEADDIVEYSDRFISGWRFIQKRTGGIVGQTIRVIFVEMAFSPRVPRRA